MVYETKTTERTRNVAETRSVIAAFVEASESVAGGVAAAYVPDLNNGPTLQGRALARNGAVTNDEPS